MIAESWKYGDGRMDDIGKKRCGIAMLLSLFLLGLTACEKKEKTNPETGIPFEQIQEIQETKGQASEEKEEVWYDFTDLGFVIKLPKSAEIQSKDETNKNALFTAKSNSLKVDVSRWDQVSLPSITALQELVGKATGQDTEIVKPDLVRVNWEDGGVNYFILTKEGDAYELWITPYVMKDPEVYWKVREIENSFCQEQERSADQEVIKVDGIQKEEIDYLVLVDKKHPLPEDWEEKLDLVYTVNSVGDRIPVERTAYKAYLELKEDLMKNDQIDIDLDSAYRSVQYQQEILERFTEKYGEAYAKRTVATPGSSEHHTGLALDLYFRLDGEEVYENEDLVKYPEIWKKIHAKLAVHGFILRYPGWKNGEVDYTYEPWHIRYVGAEYAGDIMSKEEFSFEDWLAEKGYTD